MLIDEKYIQNSEQSLPDVANILKRVVGKNASQVESQENISRRIQFVEQQDKLGQSIEPIQQFVERITGQNDLLPFSYFMEGFLCGQAVCRINIRDSSKNPQGFGTGFLISPRLLITNHHVLPDVDSAKESLAEFNYQTDTEGVQQQTNAFVLLPDVFFYTNQVLDFSVVAVQAQNDQAQNLSSFGFLRLNEQLGKAVVGEYLSIIQHPEGKTKQIAIRENQLIERKDNADSLWYSTDTTPGSSGSPVFNDQWEVVALHHMGVPARHPDNPNAYLGINGDAVLPDKDGKVNTDLIKWLANEGIRVSRIVRNLRENVLNSPLISAMMALPNERIQANMPSQNQPEIIAKPINNAMTSTNTNGTIQVTIPIQLSISLGQITQSIAVVQPIVAQNSIKTEPNLSVNDLLEKIEIDPDYSNRQGFDENFLGQSVPMPQLNKKQKDGAARLLAKPDEMILKYIHYSLIMCQDRKMPYFTAVNFDGPSYNKIKEGIPSRKQIGNDRWFVDKRIDSNAQLMAKFYAGNDFDLGHLVRREDPVWGETVAAAVSANNDTYHLTNASPQHGDFNRGKQLWQGLENYILDNARKKNLKVNIFAGPVMTATDKVFIGTDVQIPAEFWKIVVMVDAKNNLKASGYIISQQNLIESITESVNVFDDYKTFHVPIALIEQKTDLKFGLKTADVKNNEGLHESTGNAQIVRMCIQDNK